MSSDQPEKLPTTIEVIHHNLDFLFKYYGIDLSKVDIYSVSITLSGIRFSMEGGEYIIALMLPVSKHQGRDASLN